jgi:hypothetical protein
MQVQSEKAGRLSIAHRLELIVKRLGSQEAWRL